MGITLGVRYKTVRDSERGDLTKCVSDNKYRRFPKKLKKDIFSLLLDFTHQKDDTAGVYWWADAQFLPHDDTVLFVTSGAFEPRTNHSWVPITNVPHGRIVKIELDREKLGGEIFSYTRMANLPKLHMHPSGSYIGYIAPESIKIETIKHEEVFNKHKDLRMCNHRFIAFAPNGQLMAVLLSCSRQFELMTCKVDKGFAFHDRSVDLSRMLPGFQLVRYNEHVECKWSPDSEYIAVCSSDQFMFVLNKHLQLVVNIVSEILPAEVFPSWASTFDFNPCSCHELLAVGMNDRCVYFLNLESKTILEESEVVSKDAIDCLQYHPFGKYVAVATRNFSIYLLDPFDGDVLHHFDMHSQSPNLRQRACSVPNFIRFSFSTTGEELATTTSDGKVRVYQMPQYLTLFDLCKWAIFTQVPLTKLDELPLPNEIISKLLALPVMK